MPHYKNVSHIFNKALLSRIKDCQTQRYKNNPIRKWAEYMNRHFTKQETQGAKSTQKGSSLSAVRQMPGAPLRACQNGYHPGSETPDAGEDAEKRDRSHAAAGKNTTNPKQVGSFLKKLSMQLPYDSVTVLLGIYPREMKLYFSQKNLCI